MPGLPLPYQAGHCCQGRWEQRTSLGWTRPSYKTAVVDDMSVVTFGSCSFSSQTSFAVSSVSGCLIYKTLGKVTFLRIKTNIMLHGLKTSALQPPFYWPDQPWRPPASPARPSSARRPWFFLNELVFYLPTLMCRSRCSSKNRFSIS